MSYPLKHDYVATNDAWTQQRADDSANLINLLYTDWGRKLIPTSVKTSAYTAGAFDLVVCDATSAAFAVQLPTTPADKTLVGVVKIDSTANLVTINRGGTNKFYYATSSPLSVTLAMQVEMRVFQFQTSTGLWLGVADYIPREALDARYALNGNNVVTITVKDTNLVIQDDADTSKQGKFQAANIPTATTLTYTLPTASTILIGDTESITVQNKRIVDRVVSVASSATPAINLNITDQYNITALAANITSMTSGLTGTALDGQRLTIRFKDNGSARTIAWGASFIAGPAALLTTTSASKTHLTSFRYDGVATKWVCTMADATGY